MLGRLSIRLKEILDDEATAKFLLSFREHACFLISICFKFYEKKDGGKYLCPSLLPFFEEGQD